MREGGGKCEEREEGSVREGGGEYEGGRRERGGECEGGRREV